MKKFHWQHIEFGDGSNPFICTTEATFNKMKEKYNLVYIEDGFWLAKGRE